MNDTNWTPGPWLIRTTAQTVGTKGKLTAAVYPCDATGDNTPEGEANAHLIAAAPDLYAWLERCLAMVDDGVGPPDWDGIRVALSKARGGTP